MKKSILLASLLSLCLLPSPRAQEVDEEKLKKILALPQEEFKEAKKSLSKEEITKLTELRKAGGGKAKGDAQAGDADASSEAASQKQKGKKNKVTSQPVEWSPPTRPAQAWDPKPLPAGAPTESVRARIQNYRHSNCRGGAERERAAFGQRYTPGTISQSSMTEDILDFDVDGNPSTQDWVETIRFSMEKPWSPMTPNYPMHLQGTKFYGGYSFQYSKRNPKDGGTTEKYVNSNESVHNQQPANDWALHHLPSKTKPTPYRCFATWIYKKEDFGGGASEPGAKVSFDDTSLIGLYTQRYWQGWEGVRFVVQNGNEFFVSEKLPNDPKESVGGSGLFDFRTLAPTKAKWGKWEPKEKDFNFAFDAKTPMETRKFDDVRAVGWYLYKDTLDPTPVACKFESFEVYATVTRPAYASILTDMKEIKGPDGNFFISTTECVYDLWRAVYQWSNNQGQWCLQPRPMTYDADGDMGSMKFGNRSHSQTEPLTSVTIYDTLAWLNAMSEYEGREPVYYTDPSFARASEYEHLREPGKEIASDIVQKTKDTVFRTVLYSPFNGDDELRKRPTIYVKWDADGFRLPTPAEWNAAAGADFKSQLSSLKAADGTHPVGKTAVNANGLYDMAGNVWEVVWTFGDKMEPDPSQITVVGGGFEYPADPMKISASPYGDKPYYGSHNIGFRPVRRAKGGKPAKSEIAALSADIPKWSISKNDKTAAGKPDPLDLKLTSVAEGKMKITFGKKGEGEADMEITSFQTTPTEVTYRQWKPVYFWATEKGYTFDRDGDMGSMDHMRFFGEHSPDEPVTDIGFHDIMVWCNALSEMQGKPQMFYTDKEKTKPYKNAFRYRPHEYRNIDHLVVKDRKTRKIDAVPNIFIKWDQDGYRLPTQAEWLHAYMGGASTDFPWGEEFGTPDNGVGQHAWYFPNAKNKTQEVAKKKSNGFGLYDMAGNAIEYVMDGGYKGLPNYQRGQTKNPISYCTPTAFDDHSRFQAVRNGFLYDDIVAFEQNTPTNNEIWAGVFGNQGYPDMGFRPMIAQKGVYHPDGIDPNSKPTFATPLDLNR